MEMCTNYSFCKEPQASTELSVDKNLALIEYKQCLSESNRNDEIIQISRSKGLIYVLLDAVCQNDESNEDSDGAIQKPDVSVVLEDLGADQNGKPHNSTDQRVEP